MNFTFDPDVPPVLLHNEHGDVLFVAGQRPSCVQAISGGSMIWLLGPTTVCIAVIEPPDEVYAAFRAGADRADPPTHAPVLLSLERVDAPPTDPPEGS